MSEEIKFQALKPSPEHFRVFSERKEIKGQVGRYVHQGAVMRNLLDSQNPVTYPPEGGIHIHRVGSSMPIRGLPYPAACWANDVVKSDIIGWLRILSDSLFFPSWFLFLLLPSKIKVKKIENILARIVHRTSFVMESHILADQYMKPAAFETRKLVYNFLYYLGIDESIAYQAADIPCFIVEYDDAYCLREEDIFSLTTKEKLLRNPGKEFRRIIGIGLEREHSEDYNNHGLHKKLMAIRTLLTIVFLSRKFRNAFKKALADIDYMNLCVDKIERYTMLVAGEGYKYFGMTHQERMKILMDEYGEGPPKEYYVK